MDRTFSAGTLLFPEGAFERSLAGIRIQFLAAVAPFFAAVMVPAVHIDHDADRLDFPLHPFHRSLPGCNPAGSAGRRSADVHSTG
jgi:hypothetical protein